MGNTIPLKRTYKALSMNPVKILEPVQKHHNPMIYPISITIKIANIILGMINKKENKGILKEIFKKAENILVIGSMTNMTLKKLLDNTCKARCHLIAIGFSKSPDIMPVLMRVPNIADSLLGNKTVIMEDNIKYCNILCISTPETLLCPL